MLVDRDIKDLISEYTDDRQRLNEHIRSELARSIFRPDSQRIADVCARLC